MVWWVMVWVYCVDFVWVCFRRVVVYRMVDFLCLMVGGVVGVVVV